MTKLMIHEPIGQVFQNSRSLLPVDRLGNGWTGKYQTCKPVVLIYCVLVRFDSINALCQTT